MADRGEPGQPGPERPGDRVRKIFGSVSPYEVAALDLTNGKEIWRKNLAEIQGGNSGIVGLDQQGTVYDNTYYISTVPGNAGVFYAGGAQGVLFALNQANGNVVWNFSTLQTTDYWGHPEINSGGGCWFPPAVDTNTGNIFWGIANPAPFPGQPKQPPAIPQDWPNGLSRTGDNLYTDSVISFDHKTGAMNWYTQVWPHDISDYDLQQAPVLATATINNTRQDIVIGAGKMGRVYAFNREKGTLLWETAVGIHYNDTLPAFPTDGTITVSPGFYGGVETPMAYADGVVFVAANNIPADVTNGLKATIHPFSEGTGDLVAIDVNTGTILWDKNLPSALFGGATVVNDLVFTGTFDGMLYAFDRTTGDQRMELPGTGRRERLAGGRGRHHRLAYRRSGRPDLDHRVPAGKDRTGAQHRRPQKRGSAPSRVDHRPDRGEQLQGGGQARQGERCGRGAPALLP